ncbi:MAG TPA: HPr(Ser) kinase/phosphatase [Candidatus Polarisedimenticolaceae bacterium]|nr:HPr(Ser) kinase/phosphatase [Candidatus Polarisedimenticolaceae bacterium]
MGEHESCAIPSMAVRELLTDEAAEGIHLSLVSGAEGLDNIVNQPRIQKPGLALAGFLEYIHPGRIQILGKSEFTFLAERTPGERSRILSQLCREGGSCFVLTSNLEPMREMIEETERHNIPLLRTSLTSSTTIDKLTRFLEDRLAPRVVLHGVLLDVYGLGVLLFGDSGVGKSECALDLVVRGHRLVSDDVVEIRRKGNMLLGTGPELTRYHMELRGVGIVNVKDLFGVAAVRMNKYVEYVIRLDPWRAGKKYDRLGLDEQTYEVLGIELPYVEMPVGPGRNLSVLIEVAARNHLLKLKGYHPARELARRLGEKLHPHAYDPDDEDEEVRAAVRRGRPEEGES